MKRKIKLLVGIAAALAAIVHISLPLKNLNESSVLFDQRGIWHTIALLILISLLLSYVFLLIRRKQKGVWIILLIWCVVWLVSMAHFLAKLKFASDFFFALALWPVINNFLHNPVTCTSCANCGNAETRLVAGSAVIFMLVTFPLFIGAKGVKQLSTKNLSDGKNAEENGSLS